MKTTNQVQKLCAGRASFYDRLFVDFLGWGKELETFFRRSDYIHPNATILDAGCGTGIITRILYQLAQGKGGEGIEFHAFDLTQNMLDVFRRWIVEQGANNIELKEADVLEIEALPSHWNDYDLIVSSTMLEYLPRHSVPDAVRNLRQRLKDGGMLLVFVTRRNFLTRWLGQRWWKTNVYDVDEIQTIFREVGFEKIERKRLSSWWSNSIIVLEARK